MSNIMDNIDILLRGLLSGFFIAYLLILGLRPAVMYPDNILDIIDNPWIFLVLLIINYYIYLWDDTIGILMFLTLVALLLDIILFTDGGFFKENIKFEIFSNQSFEDINKIDFVKPTISENDKKTYKDVNKIILEKMKNEKKNMSVDELMPAPFII